MKANLVEVRDKLRRAHDHIAELDRTIQQWGIAEQKTNPFTAHHQSDRKRMVIRHGKVGRNNPDWTLIVGDIIHNLRSALDHIVCQLAILNGNDLSCCDATFFPVCICKPDFKRADKKLEHLVSAEALAVIEQLQPYQAAERGKRPIADVLWTVHKLNIIDKHRTVLVVGKKFRATDVTYTLDDAAPVSVEVEASWRPLEDGTEIASIDLSKVTFKQGAENVMHMQGGTEAQVIIDETGCGCDGLEVGKVMLACERHVSDIIEIVDSKFFSS